jgi:hypothetical protein
VCPSPVLQAACDDLLEAGIPQGSRDAGSSLAVDWSDLEAFSRPPPRGTSDCADPEASWGHRKNNLRHDEDELFFGYYLPAAVMVPDEQGPPVPELARRMTLSSCRHDPVPAFTPVLTAMRPASSPRTGPCARRRRAAQPVRVAQSPGHAASTRHIDLKCDKPALRAGRARLGRHLGAAPGLPPARAGDSAGPG